jgi:hypothetical protein
MTKRVVACQGLSLLDVPRTRCENTSTADKTGVTLRALCTLGSEGVCSILYFPFQVSSKFLCHLNFLNFGWIYKKILLVIFVSSNKWIKEFKQPFWWYYLIGRASEITLPVIIIMILKHLELRLIFYPRSDPLRAPVSSWVRSAVRPQRPPLPRLALIVLFSNCPNTIIRVDDLIDTRRGISFNLLLRVWVHFLVACKRVPSD